MMFPMPRPRPRDLNKLAARLVAEATGTVSAEDRQAKDQKRAAQGRIGGLQGGKARAAKLTAKRRREIAKKAARARWSR